MAQEKYHEFFEKFDGLSEKGQKSVTKFLDFLILEMDSLPKKKTQIDKEGFSLELERTHYELDFFTYHGKKNLNKSEKLEIIIDDLSFKQDSIFYCLSFLTSSLAMGHHKFDTETLLHSISSLCEIGFELSRNQRSFIDKSRLEVKANV
jgi:hypothetical protein